MARCTSPELQFDIHIGPEHEETSGTLNLTVVFGPPLGRNGVDLNCFQTMQLVKTEAPTGALASDLKYAIPVRRTSSFSRKEIAS